MWPFRIDVFGGSVQKNVLGGYIGVIRRLDLTYCVFFFRVCLALLSARCIFIFAYTQMDLDNKTRGRKKCLFIYALGSTVPSHESMRATQA